MSKGATLDLKNQAGQYIFTADSTGDETAINITKPWKLVMDLIKQFKNEQNMRTAEESSLAPPSEAHSEGRVLGETAESTDTAQGKQWRRMSREVTSCHEIAQDPTAARCRDVS